jgi:hypothetical protein
MPDPFVPVAEEPPAMPLPLPSAPPCASATLLMNAIAVTVMIVDILLAIVLSCFVTERQEMRGLRRSNQRAVDLSWVRIRIQQSQRQEIRNGYPRRSLDSRSQRRRP